MYFIDIYNDGRIAVIKELNKKVLYSTYIDNVKVKGGYYYVSDTIYIFIRQKLYGISFCFSKRCRTYSVFDIIRERDYNKKAEANLLRLLVGDEGFEPPTPWV